GSKAARKVPALLDACASKETYRALQTNYLERTTIRPSPVLRTNTLPPLPTRQRLTRCVGVTSSVRSNPSGITVFSAFVSTVKFEPGGTASEIEPSPVLAVTELKLPSIEIEPSPVRASNCP